MRNLFVVLKLDSEGVVNKMVDFQQVYDKVRVGFVRRLV